MIATITGRVTVHDDPENPAIYIVTTDITLPDAPGATDDKSATDN